MTISMYQASVPVFIHMLTNLVAILEKAQAFARDRDIEESVLINSRLAPDMLPLSRQIQIATDIIRRGLARLAGQEPESVEDKEQTFAELYDRIRKTIDRIDDYAPDDIDGSEERAVDITVRKQLLRFNGRDFLLLFMLPNVYFHITTAYDILRHNGVQLGKADYLGRIGQ